MKVSELIQAVQSKFADSTVSEDYIIVVYTTAKFTTETEEGEDVNGIGFDIIGPLENASETQLQVANILDTFEDQPYSLHVVHGIIRDNSLHINPDVADWEIGARERRANV